MAKTDSIQAAAAKDGLRGAKSEIPNSKSQTNSKPEIQMAKTVSIHT
jgi:hypothetical protein